MLAAKIQTNARAVQRPLPRRRKRVQTEAADNARATTRPRLQETDEENVAPDTVERQETVRGEQHVGGRKSFMRNGRRVFLKSSLTEFVTGGRSSGLQTEATEENINNHGDEERRASDVIEDVNDDGQSTSSPDETDSAASGASKQDHPEEAISSGSSKFKFCVCYM